MREPLRVNLEESMRDNKVYGNTVLPGMTYAYTTVNLLV